MNFTGPEPVDEVSHAAFDPGNPKFINHIKGKLMHILYEILTMDGHCDVYESVNFLYNL